MNKIIINGERAEVQDGKGQTICTLNALQGPQGLGIQAEVQNREACTVEYQGQQAQQQAKEGGGNATGQGQQIME